jgi:hypothetical protein
MWDHTILTVTDMRIATTAKRGATIQCNQLLASSKSLGHSSLKSLMLVSSSGAMDAQNASGMNKAHSQEITSKTYLAYSRCCMNSQLSCIPGTTIKVLHTNP